MLTKIAEQYIKLALAADNLLGKGTIVDTYYGDPSLVDDLPEILSKYITPDELLAGLQQLRMQLAKDVSSKPSYFSKTYIDKQIASLITHIRLRIRSYNPPYSEAVKLLLDTHLLAPSYFDINKRYNCLKQLFHQIDLKGNLLDMVTTWEKSGVVSAEEYIAVVERTAPKFLQHAYRKVLLPVLGEEIAEWLIKQTNLSFEIKETNESWSAYNYYERGFKGHIVFNKKAQRNIFGIPIFVAHEAYPGHHITALIREALYIHGIVGAEATLHLLCSPESVIMEGIGEYAYFLVEEHHKANLNTYIYNELDRLRTEVQYLADIQLYVQKYSAEKVKQFMQKKGLMSPEEVERSFKFIQEWKYYVPSYAIGFTLVKNVVERYGEEGIRILYNPCNPTILSNLFQLKRRKI